VFGRLRRLSALRRGANIAILTDAEQGTGGFRVKPIFWITGLATLVLGATAVNAGSPSGFYIRGDVGGALSPHSSYEDIDPTGSGQSIGSALIEGDNGSSIIFDAGVGYRISPAFRVDGTFGYAPSLGFSGNSNDPTNPFSFSADVRPLIGMVNGYVDIAGLMPGKFGIFQPFLLGGVGVSINRFSGGSVAGPGFTQTVSDNTNTAFAWGVGAGVGIPINDNVTIDLTYKYLDLGEVKSGNLVTDPVLGPVSIAGIENHLQLHTIMLGLRFAW
jgi:opacity protein-like surface antigen